MSAACHLNHKSLDWSSSLILFVWSHYRKEAEFNPGREQKNTCPVFMVLIKAAHFMPISERGGWRVRGTHKSGSSVCRVMPAQSLYSACLTWLVLPDWSKQALSCLASPYAATSEIKAPLTPSSQTGPMVVYGCVFNETRYRAADLAPHLSK